MAWFGNVYFWGIKGGGELVGVKICKRFKNELWSWGEWLLCSLWPILLWILRLALMYNLIRFTDFCLEISLTIFLAKYDTTLDHVMTRPIIWTASIAVTLWICINWVLSDTADIPKISLFLPLLQISSGLWPRLNERCFNELFFPVNHI